MFQSLHYNTLQIISIRFRNESFFIHKEICIRIFLPKSEIISVPELFDSTSFTSLLNDFQRQLRRRWNGTTETQTDTRFFRSLYSEWKWFHGSKDLPSASRQDLGEASCQRSSLRAGLTSWPGVNRVNVSISFFFPSFPRPPFPRAIYTARKQRTRCYRRWTGRATGMAWERRGLDVSVVSSSSSQNDRVRVGDSHRKALSPWETGRRTSRVQHGRSAFAVSLGPPSRSGTRPWAVGHLPVNRTFIVSVVASSNYNSECTGTIDPSKPRGRGKTGPVEISSGRDVPFGFFCLSFVNPSSRVLILLDLLILQHPHLVFIFHEYTFQHICCISSKNNEHLIIKFTCPRLKTAHGLSPTVQWFLCLPRRVRKAFKCRLDS